jgi:hypothetical protein
MINTDMRTYNYFTFGELGAYGTEQLSAEPVGTIKIAIYTLNTSNTNNIKYSAATYIGLTQAEVKDTYVIEYGKERLKVLYMQKAGKYTQVYLGEL